MLWYIGSETMRADQWWKNFGMGMELDAAGTFIYNALKHLHSIDTLSHPVDIFEVLYGLSVGIERLQKVAIILLEHDVDVDIEQLEESLITHNTMDLSNRIDDHVQQSLSGVHKELLSILSKFYKSRFIKALFDRKQLPKNTERCNNRC